MKKVVILVLFYFLLVTFGWAHDLHDIQSIEIQAGAGGWGGLRGGEINKLFIKRVGNNFIIENTGKPLDSNMVNFINCLLKIINEPIMNDIELRLTNPRPPSPNPIPRYASVASIIAFIVCLRFSA